MQYNRLSESLALKYLNAASPKGWSCVLLLSIITSISICMDRHNYFAVIIMLQGFYGIGLCSKYFFLFYISTYGKIGSLNFINIKLIVNLYRLINYFHCYPHTTKPIG